MGLLDVRARVHADGARGAPAAALGLPAQQRNRRRRPTRNRRPARARGPCTPTRAPPPPPPPRRTAAAGARTTTGPGHPHHRRRHHLGSPESPRRRPRAWPAIHPELAEHTHLYSPPQVHHIGARPLRGGLEPGQHHHDRGRRRHRRGRHRACSQRQATEVLAELRSHHRQAGRRGDPDPPPRRPRPGDARPARRRRRLADGRRVPVYAHASLMDEYSQENVLIGPIMNARAIPMYNLALSGERRRGHERRHRPTLRGGRRRASWRPPTPSTTSSRSPWPASACSCCTSPARPSPSCACGCPTIGCCCRPRWCRTTPARTSTRCAGPSTATPSSGTRAST